MGLFQPPPPNPVVSATGAQPSAPSKSAAIIPPPPVDNPPVNSRPSVAEESAIRRMWEPPDPLPAQVYGIPRRITPPSVDNPPFDQRFDQPHQLQNRSHWIPPDPMPILRKPICPGVPGQSIDNPPFDRRRNQPHQTQNRTHWIPPDPQPQQAKIFNPTVLGSFGPKATYDMGVSAWAVSAAAVSGDTRPGVPLAEGFNPFARPWLAGIVQTWQPPDPTAILPGRLSPGIPGQSIDNPPLIKFRRQPILQTWQPPDPPPVQRGPLSPGIPGQSVDNPPLRFYKQRPPPQPPDPPYPQQPGKLSPGIPGQSVDNPPLLLRQSLPQIEVPPQPTLPGKYPQPFVAVAEQNPFALPWLSSVIQAWQAGDVQAVIRQLLNPSFLAVPVNDPPFDRRHLEDFLRAWQPLDPSPYQRPPFVIQGAQVDNPPFDRRRFEDFLRAWQPTDPLPILPHWLPADLLAVRVDNPPGGFFQIPIWSDDLPLPILPRQLSPGIPGQSVDNPPTLVRQLFQPIEEVRLPILPVRFPQEAVVAAAQPFVQAWLSIVLQAWIDRAPDFVRRLQLNPDILAVPVNNPPFTMRGRTELANIVGQWPLEQWLIRQVLLNPDFLAVPVNNPPFTHFGRKELAELLSAWQPGPFDFATIQKLAQVVQEGPFVPPVIVPERFTVSGPSVQDLFGPIGDVSHNWGGGTQKRTV